MGAKSERFTYLSASALLSRMSCVAQIMSHETVTIGLNSGDATYVEVFVVLVSLAHGRRTKEGGRRQNTAYYTIKATRAGFTGIRNRNM